MNTIHVLVAITFPVVAFVVVFVMRLWTIRRRHQGGTPKERKTNAFWAGITAFCFAAALCIGLLGLLPESVRGIVMAAALLGTYIGVTLFRATQSALGTATEVVRISKREKAHVSLD